MKQDIQNESQFQSAICNCLMECDQPAPDRAADGVGAVRGAELARDRRDVELDRLIADAEPRRDRLVRQPFGEQLEHLDLARASAALRTPRRRRRRRGGAVSVLRHDDRVDRRGRRRAPPRASRTRRAISSAPFSSDRSRARSDGEPTSRRAFDASVQRVAPASPIVTVRSATLPPRRIFSGTCRPTPAPNSCASSCSGDDVAWPSNSSSTSPTSTPAAAAGPPLVTPDDEQRLHRVRRRPAGSPAARPAVPRARDSRASGCRARARVAAVFHAIAAGMTTPRPRIGGGGRDADQPAGGVEKRAAGKAVVHRRGGPDHLVDRPAAAGRQRSADHRHDAGAGGDDVAPRARDGEREMADARAPRRPARAAACPRPARRAARRGSSSDPSRRAPRRASGRRRCGRGGRLRGRARAPSSAPRCQRTRARWPAGGGPAPARRTATPRLTASAS